MPYYGAGDYYRGDYYQGDFLGIGKGLKKLARGALGAVGGFLTAGPLGAIKGAASSFASQQRPQIHPIQFGGPGGAPEGGISGLVHRAMPGGYSGYLPRRHMNVTNVRALRRAGRRVKGFLKLAHRLGALPVNRGKGKQLFKRKRAR